MDVNWELSLHTTVSLACNPLLQPQPDPLQAIRSVPLHPPLYLPSPGTHQLYINGSPGRCGPMDGLQRILRLRAHTLLLGYKTTGAEWPLPIGDRSMAYQRGDSHNLRRDHFDHAHASIMETADSKAAEMGYHYSFRARSLVSKALFPYHHKS